jgi:uncharacterized membrane protein
MVVPTGSAMRSSARMVGRDGAGTAILTTSQVVGNWFLVIGGWLLVLGLWFLVKDASLHAVLPITQQLTAKNREQTASLRQAVEPVTKNQ